ncbi:MAG: DUF883 family protein [Hyphomicrobiales bacterium]|nr:DUF883 family protein [Hyphomicrobiales bacterium]MDE2115405.1 DUF883 family protein [Hyphomicrobiales bacterium]
MSAPTPAEEAFHDFNQLRADLASLKDSVAALLKEQAKSASSTISDSISNSGDQINAKMADLNGAAKHAGDQAAAGLRSASHDLEATINHNPLTAVLIAAGVGLLFGMLGARN